MPLFSLRKRRRGCIQRVRKGNKLSLFFSRCLFFDLIGRAWGSPVSRTLLTGVKGRCWEATFHASQEDVVGEGTNLNSLGFWS